MAINDIWDAEHPIRQCAIDILEEVEDRTGIEINKELWFELEDFITNKITEILPQNS